MITKTIITLFTRPRGLILIGLLMGALTLYSYSTVTPSLHIELDLLHHQSSSTNDHANIIIRLYKGEQSSAFWEETHDDALVAEGAFGVSVGLHSPQMATLFKGSSYIGFIMDKEAKAQNTYHFSTHQVNPYLQVILTITKSYLDDFNEILRYRTTRHAPKFNPDTIRKGISFKTNKLYKKAMPPARLQIRQESELELFFL